MMLQWMCVGTRNNDERKERNLSKKEIKKKEKKEDPNKTKGKEYLMSIRILDIRKRL